MSASFHAGELNMLSDARVYHTMKRDALIRKHLDNVLEAISNEKPFLQELSQAFEVKDTKVGSPFSHTTRRLAKDVPELKPKNLSYYF